MGIRLIKNKAPQPSPHFDLRRYPDLFPALACTCAGLSMDATFTGIDHLQHKESNRIAAVQNELARLGTTLQKKETGYFLSGVIQPGKYRINTYNDHRLAMAFAPLAMAMEEITIENPDCVNKSFPLYWKQLERTGFTLEDVL